MTTLLVSTFKTMTYNEEESARAFAVLERIASLIGQALQAVRHPAPAHRVEVLRITGALRISEGSPDVATPL